VESPPAIQRNSLLRSFVSWVFISWDIGTSLGWCLRTALVRSG
jgi:hypothetical protein